MTIEILDLAEADLLAGHSFYERQAEGIGDYFLDSLSADIESLRLYAGAHRKVFGFYRLLSERFPFAIYYRMKRGHIEVWRVLDCRMAPANIREQLAPSGV